MKKVVKYIVSIFTDSKGIPSLRRILAFILTMHFIHIVNRSLSIFSDFIKDREHLDAGIISSVGSTLANVAMIVGIEGGLIAALLALTTYQAFQFDKNSLSSNDNIGNNNSNEKQKEPIVGSD